MLCTYIFNVFIVYREILSFLTASNDTATAETLSSKQQERYNNNKTCD